MPVVQVFRGPWTVAAVGQFVNRQCARTARIGRVYAADILAAHFTTAAGPAERRSVREALRLLQLHHSDGSSDVHAKEYFRFYADIMEVRAIRTRSVRLLSFLGRKLSLFC